MPDLVSLERRPRDRAVSGQIDLEAIHQLALVAARAAVSVKADDVKVLDMHELVSYTDFLVVCTGSNTRLTRRIAEEVALRLKTEAGLRPLGTEGAGSGEWILLDFLDFVVHVFTPKAREFYRLDVLWRQAPAETVT